MKNIVVTSNPFGYGPTGKAILVSRLLLNDSRFSDCTVYFVGSGICLEIIGNDLLKANLKVIEGNERDIDFFRSFLQSLQGDTLCLGFQNRFIPLASKEVGIPCFFIDSLAWFWEKTPDSHFVADKIYWTNFLNIHFGDKEVPKNVKLIGTLQSTVDRTYRDGDEKVIIVSLGGAKNPLVGGLQKNYLALAVEVFDIVSKKLSTKVDIVCGREALEYMRMHQKEYSANSLMHFNNYSQQEMMAVFSKAHHHFSAGGQTSSMEALTSKVPTSFYLPSNLSQVRFQDHIDTYINPNLTCHWDLFIGQKKEMMFEEKIYISYIDELARQIREDKDLIMKCANRCIQTMGESMEKMFAIFEEMNQGGGQTLVNDIFDHFLLRGKMRT